LPVEEWVVEIGEVPADQFRRIVFEWAGKRMRVTGAVTLEPVDGGTRVSTHNDIRSTGAFRLLEGLIARGVRREERTMFERLRTRLS
jgi:hypothetical protein